MSIYFYSGFESGGTADWSGGVTVGAGNTFSVGTPYARLGTYGAEAISGGVATNAFVQTKISSAQNPFYVQFYLYVDSNILVALSSAGGAWTVFNALDSGATLSNNGYMCEVAITSHTTGTYDLSFRYNGAGDTIGTAFYSDITLNEWHLVAMYVYGDNNSVSSSGIIRGWIDGVQVGNATGLLFGGAIAADTFSLGYFTDSSLADTGTIYVDEFYVATDLISPQFDTLASTDIQTVKAIPVYLFADSLAFSDTTSSSIPKPSVLSDAIYNSSLGSTYLGATYLGGEYALQYLFKPHDVIPISDTFSISIVKVISDSISSGDNMTLPLEGVFKDTVTLSDIISKSISYNFQDSLSSSDLTSFPGFEDAVSISDAISKTILFSITDSLSSQDTFLYPQMGVYKDSIVISDNISKVISKVDHDNLTFQDIIAKSVTLNTDDVLGASDFARNGSFYPVKNYISTVGGTYLGETYLGGSSTFSQIDQYDPITLTDAFSYSFYKTFFETVSLSETIDRDFTYSFSDIIVWDDDFKPEVNGIFNEPIILLDSFTISVILQRTLVDTLGTSDEIYLPMNNGKGFSIYVTPTGIDTSDSKVYIDEGQSQIFLDTTSTTPQMSIGQRSIFMGKG
jgi:hypothetical protein